MANHINTITSLIQDYQLIIRCKSRLQQVIEQLRIENERLIILNSKVDKEYYDIVRLEKMSLHSIFSSILKNKEEQLEKERQEYLLVVLEFDECHKLIELLLYEEKILNAKIRDESILLDTIERSLLTVDDQVLLEESMYLAELKVINQELSKLIQLKIEVQDVLDVTVDIKNHLLQMIRSLNKVNKIEGWGMSYAEIQKKKVLRKSNIDFAHTQLHVIKKLLVYLRDELEDVEEVKSFFNRSEVLIRGFNTSYYNNLISDWINDDELKETMTTTFVVSKSLAKLTVALQRLIENANQEITIVKAKRKTIISRIKSKR